MSTRLWDIAKSLWQRWWFAIVPVCIAAVVFGSTMSMYPTPPLFRDSLGYVRTAQRVVHHRTFAFSTLPVSAEVTPNATVPPAYVLLLAAIHGVVSPDVASYDAGVVAVQPYVIGFQFLMALGVVLLVALGGHQLGGRRLGFVAGLLASLYLPFVWAASVSLSDLLGAFLISVQVLVALTITARGRQPRLVLYVLLGFTSALLGLVRPVYALWSLVPLAYALWNQRRLLRHVAWGLAAFVIAFSLTMAPWWVRNAVTLDKFVVFRTEVGAPALDGVGGLPLTESEEELAHRAESNGEDGLLAVARERLATEWVTSPTRFIGWRLTRMWAAFTSSWNAVHDVYLDEYFEPNKSKVVVEPFTPPPTDQFVASQVFASRHHWLVAFGALLALPFARRSPRILVLASLPLYSFGVHLLTLFTDRYFFPVMPAILVMSAGGLYGTFELARRHFGSHAHSSEDVAETIEASLG